MQQLFIVYVREKYKIYSSLFSAFEYKLRGATWGDCIQWICNLEVIFQHEKMSEINILLYEQLAGLI